MRINTDADTDTDNTITVVKLSGHDRPPLVRPAPAAPSTPAGSSAPGRPPPVAGPAQLPGVLAASRCPASSPPGVVVSYVAASRPACPVPCGEIGPASSRVGHSGVVTSADGSCF